MTTTPRDDSPRFGYQGRHRRQVMTRTVFAALATAAVLGSGMTAASAAPALDDATPVAEAQAEDRADSSNKKPNSAPGAEKPKSPESGEKAPDKPESNNAKKKPKPKPSSWVVPSADAISDTFGPRSWRGGQQHDGMDFAAETGDPNLAASSGKVTAAGPNGGFGKLVVINHGKGVETWYGHHSKLSVSVGDKVKTGDRIGLAGTTGDITGPHLHFEVHINGAPVDPHKYLKGKGVKF